MSTSTPIEPVKFRAYPIEELPIGSKIYLLGDAKRLVYVIEKHIEKKWTHGVFKRKLDKVKIHLKENPKVTNEVSGKKSVVFLNP